MTTVLGWLSNNYQPLVIFSWLDQNWGGMAAWAQCSLGESLPKFELAAHAGCTNEDSPAVSLKLMKAKWGTFCHRRIDLLWLVTCKSSLEVFGPPCGCFQWFQLCSGLTLPSQICFPKHRACLNRTSPRSATWNLPFLRHPGLVWCQRTSKIACRRADFGEEIIETPPCGDGHLRRRARIWRSWASTFR